MDHWIHSASHVYTLRMQVAVCRNVLMALTRYADLLSTSFSYCAKSVF